MSKQIGLSDEKSLGVLHFKNYYNNIITLSRKASGRRRRFQSSKTLKILTYLLLTQIMWIFFAKTNSALLKLKKKKFKTYILFKVFINYLILYSIF